MKYKWQQFKVINGITGDSPVPCHCIVRVLSAYMANGSRQIGPRQIGPRQIGPLANLAANWAPHFLGPNLPFFGKSGPGRLGPLAADWAPANWAPADWAPCRQIGPRQIGPRQIGPLGGKLGPSKSSPGKLGPCFIFICIGYILPTIGGYMSFGGCQCSLREQGWGICIF